MVPLSDATSRRLASVFGDSDRRRLPLPQDYKSPPVSATTRLAN
jgi:hypothetical protein